MAIWPLPAFLICVIKFLKKRRLFLGKKMTKKIDKTQLIKDFREGKSYTEMALRQKCSIQVITYRLKKLHLRRELLDQRQRNKQFKEKLSTEEKDSIKSLMDTRRGREQLLDILKDK